MEIISYAEEHRIFREALRKFFDREVVPYIEEWEEDGIVPKNVWQKMGEQGFLCMQVPEEFGGLGADFLYSVILMEELGKSNFFGLLAPLHSDIVVPYILSYASNELKAKYLPGCVSGDTITAVAMTEPNAGSDLAGMRTTAVEDGDHVVINGQKTFISNGIVADLIVLAARNPKVETPPSAIDLYLVE
ncbi:MAG: acyl-CoA dehydrogenase family protein, partial [Desulfomonile tiedjei]|nr:acyl-CoA dehydrogenase family protein [Desulfomonile tiedjei]